MTVEQLLNMMNDADNCVEVRYYLNQDEWTIYHDISRSSMHHTIISTPEMIIRNDLCHVLIDKECDLLTKQNGIALIVCADRPHNHSTTINDVLNLIDSDRRAYIIFRDPSTGEACSEYDYVYNIKNLHHILELECNKIYFGYEAPTLVCGL